MKTEGEGALSSLIFKSNSNPNVYEENYKQLLKFVDGSLDSYRHELCKLLYPVFVHMYLELVSSDHSDQAVSFMNMFGKKQELAYTRDIQRLAMVTHTRDFSIHNEVIQTFRDSTLLYTIKMSRDSHNYLKRFLQDKAQASSGKAPILVNIIQEHLFIDVYDGLTRTKANVEAISGGMFGEATRDMNKTKIYYGLLKEPDLNGVEFLEAEYDLDASSNHGPDGGGDGPLQLKKRKYKKDSSGKKTRNDPNAPLMNRIPIPELREKEKKEKAQARMDAVKAKKIGNGNLPSICLHTVLNAQSSTHDSNAICADVIDDGTMVAIGFADSTIRLWELGAKKRFRTLLPAERLEALDKDSDEFLYNMFELEPEGSSNIKNLYGHSGPVYSLSFSPFKDYLISGSEDSTSMFYSFFSFFHLFIMFYFPFRPKFASGVCTPLPLWWSLKAIVFPFGMFVSVRTDIISPPALMIAPLVCGRPTITSPFVSLPAIIPMLM